MFFFLMMKNTQKFCCNFFIHFILFVYIACIVRNKTEMKSKKRKKLYECYIIFASVFKYKRFLSENLNNMWKDICKKNILKKFFSRDSWCGKWDSFFVIKLYALQCLHILFAGSFYVLFLFIFTHVFHLFYSFCFLKISKTLRTNDILIFDWGLIIRVEKFINSKLDSCIDIWSETFWIVFFSIAWILENNFSYQKISSSKD